ncbi:hypothetical protein [Shimia sp. SDUM112013]|uniref:hypothetical protein n=1 Tax=Shimia sp. SDUM112013 TaxID=3136160 RepID=UPI0032F09728
MKSFVPPTGELPLDGEIEQLRKLLMDLRDVLDQARVRLKQEDAAAPGEAGKALSELRQTLRSAIDTEKIFEKRRKDRSGIVHEYKIDLDEARLAIGSRLACLRRAKHPGGVPE